jgi:hypothetical protein
MMQEFTATAEAAILQTEAAAGPAQIMAGTVRGKIAQFNLSQFFILRFNSEIRRSKYWIAVALNDDELPTPREMRTENIETLKKYLFKRTESYYICHRSMSTSIEPHYLG